MTFDEAMKLVRLGESVRRDDWHRPLCVYRGVADLNGTSVDGLWMEMRSGVIGAYAPSQCDMLADDWTIAYLVRGGHV